MEYWEFLKVNKPKQNENSSKVKTHSTHFDH